MVTFEVLSIVFMVNLKRIHFIIKNQLKDEKINNIEVYYKVPYFDAIKDYSNNWSNAVYKTEYKDVDNIQQSDPVFSCIFTQEPTKNIQEKSFKLNNETNDNQIVKEITEIKNQDIELKLQENKIENKIENEILNIDIPQIDLEFDGNFECGNLHSAIKISENEYHLFIHPDTNTGGHTQWFYFKSAFQRGMSPCVFSTSYYKAENKGWDYTETFNVDYCQNPFNQTINNSLKDKYADKYCPVGKNGKKLKSTHDASHNPRAKKLYALTFSYKCRYSEDTVFFSFATPYSYSQLNQFLDKLMIEAEKKINKSSNIEITKLELCKTLGGRSITLIKISSKKHRSKK